MVIYLFQILAILVVILGYFYVKSIQFSSRNLPPGSFVWPFGLGVIPSAIIMLLQQKSIPSLKHLKTTAPWVCFHQWSKDFGEFFSIQFGQFYGVVVASHEILTELAPLDEYSLKLTHDIFTRTRTFGKELGLIFVSKPEIWVEMRKFTQRTLREFGLGKQLSVQSVVEAEVQDFLQEIRDIPGVSNGDGGTMRINAVFMVPVVNVLWGMVAGERYAHDDPNLAKLVDLSLSVIKSTTLVNPLVMLAPRLNKALPWLLNEDVRIRGYKESNDFTKRLVEERKATKVWASEPHSFIDVFLKKIEDNREDPDTVYTELQLQSMLGDLFQTGSVTTNGTLNYALLYFIRNPDMQRRCREEIDRVVPRHLRPTPEDIEKMPYFQAFILETHRLANVVPIPIPRLAPKDWHFRGYQIPEGAFIIANHYSVHMDKEYWGDPEVFRPDRFINEKGEFVQDKRVVHFGYGKRICIGIKLVNHVVSVFLAILLQNFQFSVVPGESAPTTEPEIGVSLSPKEFSVLVRSRRHG